MYAIAKVIGVGTSDNPIRADALNYKSICCIPGYRSGADRGKPKNSWCVVYLTDPDNESAQGLFKLPKISFATKVGAIPKTVRAAIKNKLDSLGVDTSWITLDSTFGEIVKKLIKHVRPEFPDKEIKE